MDESRNWFLYGDSHEKWEHPFLLLYDTKVEMRASPKDYHSENVDIYFLFLGSNLGLVAALVFCISAELISLRPDLSSKCSRKRFLKIARYW